MIFCHSPADTATNKKIMCPGEYQNYSEVSSNMSAISRIFYEGLEVNSGSENVFLVKKSPKRQSTAPNPLPWLVIGPIWAS